MNQILTYTQFHSICESESSGGNIDLSLDNLSISAEEIADVMSKIDPKELKEANEANPFKPILPGERGARVKWLQQQLKFPASEQDGIYGNKTKNAVMAFQKQNKITVDGKVGDQTLKTMIDVLKIPPAKQEELKRQIKTAKDATKAGIDPMLLDLYDIFLVGLGKDRRIILIPKPEAKKKAEQLKKSGLKTENKTGLDLLLEGLKYAGKAILYTGEGLFLITLEAAKGIIKGIISVSKMVAKGVAYVVGAAVQGLVNFSEWLVTKGKAAWNAIKDATNEFIAWASRSIANIVKGLKNAFDILWAFLSPIGYTLTGIILKVWKGLKGVFDPAIEAIIQAAKSGEELIRKFEEAIAGGIQKAAQNIVAGWNFTKENTKKAMDAGIKAIDKFGQESVEAAKKAYQETADFFRDSYEEGKKSWESTMYDIYGSDFLYEDEDLLEFEKIDFNLYPKWRLRRL